MKNPLAKSPLRKAAKAVVAAIVLMAVVAAFFGVRQCAVAARVQLVPALLALDVVALVVLLVVVSLRGRLYCEVVCPLGVVQDVFRWIARKKVRRVCSRLPETTAQRIVRWTLLVLSLAVGFLGFSFMWLDPYGIFGRGVSLAGCLFFVVLILAFVGKGRFWCNWICPVGTLLQQISKIAIFRNKVDKTDHCEECRLCFRK